MSSFAEFKPEDPADEQPDTSSTHADSPANQPAAHQAAAAQESAIREAMLAQALAAQQKPSIWELMRAHWMTTLLLTSFVVIYLIEVSLNIQSGNPRLRIDPEIVLRLGGNFPPAFIGGEYWRAVASCFLHFDGMHIAFNGLAVYILCPLIERRFGPWLLLLAFLLTGTAGSVLSNLVHLHDIEPFLSAGASGGLYGIFGMIFVDGKLRKRQLPKEYQTWINQNLGLMVIFSFVPDVDIWGHFGGLIAGVLLGLLLSMLYPPPPLRYLRQELQPQTPEPPGGDVPV